MATGDMETSPPMKTLAWELQMKDQIVRYFQAEKSESVLFVLAAVLAVLISIFLVNSANEYRWMAAPLLAIALLQAVVGGTVLLRTNQQVSRLTDQVDSDPLDYRAQELARMAAVQTNFRLYKAIEVAVLLGGIALTYALRSKMSWYSIGIGCIAQGALMLVFDLIAEHRAGVYVEHIQRLVSPS